MVTCWREEKERIEDHLLRLLLDPLYGYLLERREGGFEAEKKAVVRPGTAFATYLIFTVTMQHLQILMGV